MKPRRIMALALAALAAGCSLEEVTLAQPEDLVVAEVILRADDFTQHAFLHRTLDAPTPGPGNAEGATIEVQDDAGRTLRFAPTRISECVLPGEDQAAGLGVCYASTEPHGAFVEPGGRYRLRITLRDGGELTGETTVPGSFQVLSPATTICSLPPDTTLELRWTPSAGAWVYPVDIILRGLRQALAPRDIDVKVEPLRLLGLAAGATDTTLVFPSEFGLFDRFDSDVVPVLLAIRDGLPAGVNVDLIVAAADRNYVNWVRGGDFNPSGMVQIPSITGAGTGVFAAVVPHVMEIRVGGSNPTRC